MHPYRDGKLPRRRWVLPIVVDCALFSLLITFGWVPFAIFLNLLYQGVQ